MPVNLSIQIMILLVPFFWEIVHYEEVSPPPTPPSSVLLREAANKKKVSFLSGQSTKLVEKRTVVNLKKKTFKKFIFSLVDNLLPPPLLVDCPLKNFFFAGSQIIEIFA